MKPTYRPVYIDTETGGLDPDLNPLLSVAAVPSWDQEPFYILILPEEGTIEPDAAAVNGYSPENWSAAVPVDTAMRMLLAWFRARPADIDIETIYPVAHNADFDRAFLERAMDRTGVHVRFPSWMCSRTAYKLAQEHGLLPAGGHTLQALCDHYGIHRPEPHDALSDATALRAAVERMMADIDARTNQATAAA